MTILITVCFLCAAACYAFGSALSIPFVGFFPFVGLLVAAALAAPYLVNAGFILLAAHGLSSGRNRIWLVLPALWFGGYYAVLAYERYHVRVLDRETKAASLSTVAFDPSANDVGVLRGEGMSGDLSLYHRTIAEKYAIPRVASLYRKDDGIAVGLVAAAFGPGFCTERTGEKPRGVFDVHRLGDDGSCIVTADSLPRSGTVEIRLKPLVVLENERLPSLAVVGSDRRPREAHLVTIRRPDGPAVGIATGEYGLLSKFPMLQVFGFQRDMVHAFPFANPLEAVASHLRLRTRNPGDVEGFSPPEEGAWYKNATRSVSERALASFLANEIPEMGDGGAFTFLNALSLRERPEMVAGNGAGLVGNLEANIGKGNEATLSPVQQAISVLPVDEFSSLGGRILAIFAARPGFHFSEGFVRRLAVLGKIAEPTIVEQLETRSSTRTGAIRAICDAGPTMAYAADALVAAYLDPDGHNEHWDTTKEAAYKALRRVGRGDLIPAMLAEEARAADEKRSAHMRHPPKDRAEYDLITPESPSDVCSTSRRKSS